jgi:hypothetical protein
MRTELGALRDTLTHFFITVPLKKMRLQSFKKFSGYYFWKVHLHHFSKIKSQKEVTKQQESRVFFLFLLDAGNRTSK